MQTSKKSVQPVKFIIKAAMVHTLTYILCGMVFSKVFNYEGLFKLGNVVYFMRDAYGLSSLIGPFFQFFRGLLFGVILLLIWDSIWGKKLAWLRLWGIIAGLGIFCTPGPAPFSIEGLIYSQLPLEFHLKIAPELLVQTLLFSVFMTSEKNLFTLNERQKPLFITLVIAMVGFSLGGIILALVLGADFMAAGSDVGAYAVMAAALITVFFAVKWYVKTSSAAASVVFYAICYAALAGFPTVYNFLSGSLLASPLSLIFSGLSLPVIALYLERVKRKLNA